MLCDFLLVHPDRFVFTTQPLPCELTFISKNIFQFQPAKILPTKATEKNNHVSKKTLFCKVDGCSVLKIPYQYEFSMP